jgi:hypothetical protein
MQRTLLAALVLLIAPASVLAARAPASFSAANALLATSSSPGNSYVAGASVVVTAPVAGDLGAAGGSVVVAAPVQGDDLLFGGSVDSRARIGGDLRVFGGSIKIEESVAGDIVAFGFSVRDSGHSGGSVFIAAADVEVTDGAGGPVTIYGNNISLAGDFASDVRVVASGHLSLAASTTILGALSYEAPEPAAIPTSALIAGGIEYTSASYLPPAGTSRILAFLSVGFFLFARVLGALILAGLLAGLFPRLAEAVALRAYTKPRSILLTMSLGFAILVAVPVLLVLLSLTFVGLGLALLLLILYALLVVLALLYAGILLGTLFVRRFAHRDTILWHDGALGMLALSLIALLPFAGLFVVFMLTAFTAGALLQLFFAFAFPHEELTTEML